MNHRTRLDWMFFWAVLMRQSSNNTLKIILKSTLKWIPGPGLTEMHLLSLSTNRYFIKFYIFLLLVILK